MVNIHYKNCDSTIVLIIFQDSRKILAEVVDLLKHEPLSLPEGKIYAQAVTNMKDIDLVINAMHSTIGDTP